MELAVATPMHITAPVSEGTLRVVRVSSRIQAIPARAPGRAVMMMKGSSQDWKFTTIRKYTRTIAATSPIAKAHERGPHGAHLSPQDQPGAARQMP